MGTDSSDYSGENRMSRKVISTEKAPAAVGAYSQAIAANRLVFVSGQLGLLPETKAFAGDTVAAQTGQALKNMAAILEAAGTDMAHVVKCTVLLADISAFGEMNQVYSTFFPVEPPARAAFAVKDLPLGALVEIEAFAVLPD
jgi:reactive intermediate/imine deaminase